MRTPPALADRSSSLVAWTLAWRGASAVVALALSRVLTQGLGVSGFGRYALVLSILVTLQLLATAGQDQVLLRYLPELVARGNRAGIADLARKVTLVIVAAWAIVLLVAYAARPILESTLQVRIGDVVTLGAALLLAGIAAGVLSFGLVAVYDMRTQALVVPLGGLVSVVAAGLLLQRGAGVAGALIAGAAGQALVAVAYLVVLRRTVRRGALAGRPLAAIDWPRLLRYAAGWLPNLLFASLVVVQFENFFLARFAGPEAVGYYDLGFFIPQRLITLIPSLLTGAWVVATVEMVVGGAALRAGVRSFYQGIFFVAAPLSVLAAVLLTPGITWFYGAPWRPAATIAPILLGCFVAALLAAPWSLVVRVRELNGLNAGLGTAQVLLALVSDYLLIRQWKLAGAVLAVAATTTLTLALSFLAWWAVERASLVVPGGYVLRCYAAALPLALPAVGVLLRAPFAADLLLAMAALPAWAWAVRGARLLARTEVPLLHESAHPLLRAMLRTLAPRPVP